MTTIDVEAINHNAVMTFPESDQVAAMATPGNYESVRFNAMKHCTASFPSCWPR